MTNGIDIDQRIDIELKIEKLSKIEYREVIRGLFLNGSTPVDLAESMGKSISTIYYIRKKALEELRKM